jgi:hypothetical protein
VASTCALRSAIVPLTVLQMKNTAKLTVRSPPHTRRGARAPCGLPLSRRGLQLLRGGAARAPRNGALASADEDAGARACSLHHVS